MEALSLGELIAKCRNSAGLTQEALGVDAGYNTGAGVSVSRIETGKVLPTEANLKRISNALGLTQAEHEVLQELRRKEVATVSSGQSGSVRKPNLRARKERVEASLAIRINKTEVIAAQNQAAIERASSKFFIRLIEVAAEIQDAPVDKLHAISVPIRGVDKSIHLEHAQAQLEMITSKIVDSFTGLAGKAAIASVLGAVGGAASGGLEAYVGYATIARFGIASTGALNANLYGIALHKSVMANIGGGTLINGGAGVAGGRRAIIETVAAGAAVGLINTVSLFAVKTMLERQEANREISKIESELDQTEGRFNLWSEAVPRGSSVLDYIGVHACHALEKWREGLGELPVDWGMLTDVQKTKFREFVTIAACEIAIDTTPTDQIMTVSDSELSELLSGIDGTFISAETTVKALV